MSESTLQILLDAASRTTSVITPGRGDNFPIRRTGWASTLSDCWIDPLGGTLMLRPYQLAPDFRSSATNAPRMRLSSFTVTTGSWEEVVPSDILATDYYLLSDGTANSEIRTTATWPANQAFFFSTFIFAQKSEAYVACELAFGQYTLKVFSNGWSELWEGTTKRGSGYLTPGPVDLSGRMLDMIVLPYRRRSILFWSVSAGSGWVYTDSRLPHARADSYSITSAAVVSAKFPAGTGRFQLMKLTYPTSGYAFTTAVECGVPPTADQTTTLTADTDSVSGGGVVVKLTDTDGSTMFVPDGVKTSYCARVDIAGDGNGTAQVYGISADWSAVKGTILRDELDITDSVTKFNLHIAEDPRLSTATFTVKGAGLQAMQDKLRRKCGISCIIKFGADEVFWGTLDPPRYIQDVTNELSVFDVTARSIFRWFESPNVPTYSPWDGKSHTDFIKWLLLLSDCSEDDLNVPDDPAGLLPVNPAPGGDAVWQPADGDSKDEWIRKACDLTGWILDDAPDTGRMKMRYQSRESLSSTPECTMYLAASENPIDASSWLRSFAEDPQEPEATQVWAVGCDPETEELIAAVYIDDDAEDATLAPEVRPANWMGRALPVKITENLKNMADLEKLATYVGKKITSTRIAASVSAEYVPGLWRYSPIRVGDELWRIIEMDLDCELETDAATLRPCTYTLELVGDYVEP